MDSSASFCTETIPNKQHDCPVHKNSREAGTVLHHEDLELVSVGDEFDEEKEKFASVKVPLVGGKISLSMLVKIPRCVEQQVTSTTVSVSKLSSNISLSQSFQEIKNQNGNTVDYLGLYLFKMVGELQISNFSLFVECISGYSTPYGLDLQQQNLSHSQQHVQDVSRIFHYS